MARFNVLYVHSHDTGRYVRPYGYDVPTPNLQALAERGVLFRQAFCAAPTCSPSRAALLTGRWPHASGMLGLAHRGFALSDYGQHVVHTLKAAGYATALAGVQHVAADAAEIGYDRILCPPQSTEAVARTVAEFLRAPPAQPFFLSVGFLETHRVFPPPDPADDPRYGRAPDPLPDAPQTRLDFAGFKTSARRLDAAIGAVLGELEASGLADRTLVICTTDHGLAFPGMKCSLTDHGIGVMLILRGPGGFFGGEVCDAMVSQVDIFPTLCELLEIPAPGWLDGKSMMPLIRGHAERINEQVFAEVTYHAAYEPMRAVRTPRWKYIRRFDDRRRPVLSNCDDSLSKDLWLAAGWADRVLPDEELYDLVFDPNEAHNLAGAAAGKTALKEMRARLDCWMAETNDPLAAGYVAPPAGARVNHPDCLSPGEKRFIEA